ncbi:hypothetical protein [Planctomicrobium sp. SH664]|uniref:hypothetical protein n=1 Tax=Planctomicrobium sp. SH664 TaxID=3448125 RepID=UPI003F5BC898
MNFQVTPFAGRDKLALFQPRIEDLWKLPQAALTENLFHHSEVVAILSTANGHFPLVLQGEELVTIRDVCRKSACECAGIFDRDQLSIQMRDRLHQLREHKGRKIVF